MAHHVDARYDEGDHTFLPPLRTLGFNPQLRMNDSLLAQSYVEAYDISYPEAVRRLESEVAELRQHLETTGSYELNDLGTLFLNDEGSVVFEPCEAGILTPSLYGLSSFQMEPLARAEQSEEAPVKAQPETGSTPEEPDITIKMSWLRNVAAVAAAILAFFMIGKPISNSDIQQSAFVHIGTTATEASASASAPTADADCQSIAASTTATADTAKPTPAPQPAYTLVLASNVSTKNALTFISTLDKAGFNDARLLETSMKRVVYGTYDTEREAYSAQQQLRKQSRHFRDAWVMKVN